ncbi:MAG TPA: tail fiber domain-containing protein, partial [Leptospiraceae bacterium]|nr:tail fiber domain-containing protein [Leptospiraceae bacterium]
TSGEVLKSADLNTTISSMKTAIEGIPNWTKNGTSAYYTDGLVGIGTSSPLNTVHIVKSSNSNTGSGGAAPMATITNSNTNLENGTSAFNFSAFRAQAGNGSVGAILEADYDSIFSGVKIGSDQNYPAQIVTNSTARIHIAGSGNVGIGTTSPSANLHVVGTTLAAAWSTSDERYKKNIQNIPNPTEKILKLRGVNYEWRREEYKDLKFKAGQDFGFIGQEVEKVLPETIFKDEKGYLYVSYQTILPVLVEAFKEQKSANEKKVSVLEAELHRLKTENRRLLSLEERIKTLETTQMSYSRK